MVQSSTRLEEGGRGAMLCVGIPMEGDVGEEVKDESSASRADDRQGPLSRLHHLVHILAMGVGPEGGLDEQRSTECTERQVSVVLGEDVEAPVAKHLPRCMICFEDMALEQELFFTARVEDARCCHTFCVDCIKKYIERNIAEGRVRHPCPLVAHDDCTLYYTDEDVQTLVEPAMWEKQLRFTKMQSCEDMRECPNPECLHVMKGSKRRPAMVCEKCNTAFCFHHSNAHPDMSCRDYTWRRRTEERHSKKVIKKISKRCPKCRIPIEKIAGCNHITCGEKTCKYQWCWICESRYTPTHYSSTNIFFGCPGAQFVNTSRYCGVQYSGLVCRSVRLLLCVLLMPIPFVFGVVMVAVGTALWLPIGLVGYHLYKLCGRSKPAAMLDVLFPIFKGLRTWRISVGSGSTAYMIMLLGAGPLLFAMALAAQAAWAPVALMVALAEAVRGRRVSVVLLFLPFAFVAFLYDLDTSRR